MDGFKDFIKRQKGEGTSFSSFKKRRVNNDPAASYNNVFESYEQRTLEDTNFKNQDYLSQKLY